jgi:formate/nitrite transporter FocA (FNT family)
MELGQEPQVASNGLVPFRQRLFTLKVLFFSIQAGMWMGFGVLLFIRMTSSVSKELDPDVGRILWAIGASITCFAIVTCVFLRRMSLRLMAACEDFGEALAKFLPVMLVALAICEMAGLFQAISLLFSEEITIPIVLFLFNAILIWWLYPGGRKLLRIFEHGKG